MNSTPDEPEIVADQIPVVTEASSAPTVFADLLWHVSWLNGVARLAFVQNSTDPSVIGTPNAGFMGRHVVNIAMPMAALYGLRDYLNAMLPAPDQSDGE